MMRLTSLHTAWRGTCLGLLAFLLGARALRYHALSSAPWLDRAFGEIMVFESQTLMWSVTAASLLFVPVLLALLAAAFFLRGRLARKEGGVWSLTPAALSAVYGFMVWTQYLFDLNPFVAVFCGLSALVPRLRTAPRRLVTAAWVIWFAAWTWAAHDFADRAAVLAWAPVLFVAAPAAARRLGAREVRLALLLAIIPMNLLTAAIPLAVPLHGGSLLGGGFAFDFCESSKHGRLLATVPACGSVSSFLGTKPDCRRGRVAVYDNTTLERLTDYDFFSDGYSGRLEQISCLGDEAVVGLHGTRYRGDEDWGQTALSFPIATPEKFTPVLVGRGVGAVFAHDARRDALIYSGEAVMRILRQDRRSGQMNMLIGENLRRRWAPNPLVVRGASLDRVRDRLYMTEWVPGRYAYALDLATLQPAARYDMRNGGSQSAAVDVERDRLYVPGLWGLEIFDLATGQLLRRKRLGLINRTPVVDAARNRIYVASTMDGKIRVLDRDTLEVIEQIPIGFGTRQTVLSLDGKRLFASSRLAHYFWALP